MSILLTQFISDIKSEFEGGASLSVDYYSILRRAADNVLDNLSPDTLKRRLAVYAGLANDLQIYYCPADLEAPSDIYENDGRFGNQQVSSRKFGYVPPSVFYSKLEYDKYTIEYVNGVRFVVVRHTEAPTSTTIEEMEVTTGKTSDQTLSLNEHDFVYGTAAIQRTFAAESGTAFTTDFTTDYLTSTAHGLSNGDRIMVYSSTTLPASLASSTVYFVINKTADTFQVSLTSGGSAVNLTDNGTGTHYWHAATQNEISATITAIDISDLLKGAVIIPIVFSSAVNVNRVEFVLETDTGNYYTLTSTADSIGDNFIDGMNMVRFWMANAVATGTPTNTSIVKWRLRVILDSGATAQKTIVDWITIQKSSHRYLEYGSNRMFIDGTTGAWKNTPVAGDSANVSRIVAGILHYEAVVLIAQNSSFVKLSAQEIKNFTDQLQRKYDAYWARFPSSEEPLSYNTLPPLPSEAITDFGKEQLDVITDDD